MAMALPEDIQELLAPLQDSELEALRREQELGEALHFSEAVDVALGIRRMLEALSSEEPEELPQSLFAEIRNHLGQVNGALNNIQNFDPGETQNPGNERTSYINQIKTERDWFAQEVRPQLRGDVEAVSRMIREADEARQEMIERRDEYNQLVDRLRLAAGQRGARNMSGYYSERAGTHRNQSITFFWSMVIALAATAALGLWLFVWAGPSTGDGTAQVVRDLLVRLFFVGLATFAVAFAARNYRINKHLEIANDQKAAALDTYAMFAEAADEDRSIVTAALVHAVFESSDTGFLGEKQERTIVEGQSGLMSLLMRRPTD